MAIIKYGNDYVVKTGNGGRNNSGPSGRRKTRPFRVMREKLADAAKKYGIVVCCNDQHRGLGTMIQPKNDELVNIAPHYLTEGQRRTAERIKATGARA